MNIKNIFRITTVIITAISLTACSSSPKKPYTYKNELKEFESMDELPEGVLEATGEDGSKIKMIVNKNHKIKLISKDSPLYDDIEQCKIKLSTDSEKVKALLYSNGGKFDKKINTVRSDYTYSYSSNKEFKIVVKNCYKNNDKYKYNIQITPENSNKDIPKKITHSILDALGFVIAVPFMIVGYAIAFLVAGIIVFSFKLAGVKF